MLDEDSEAGFSLIEVLVALFLFSLLMTILFTVATQNTQAARNVSVTSDLNEQSRLVLNRLSRELREADVILYVSGPGLTVPASTVTDTVITFDVDLDRNLIIEENSNSQGEPERITYRFVPGSGGATGQLQLKAGGSTYPILAENVTVFRLDFFSQKWQCDLDPADGKVTWQEIDRAPIAGGSPPCPASIGDNDGNLDPQELLSISAVQIDLSVLTGTRRQDYRTRVDLRNRAGI